MIKISLRDIHSKGLDLDLTIPKESIGLSDEEVDIRSALHVKAHVERMDNTIIAHTDVEADFGFMCARCLKDLHEVQLRSFTFDFDALEVGEYLDLGEEVRQEMIMANPPKVLCKTLCKGICSKCGANLNEEQCRCPLKADQPLADK